MANTSISGLVSGLDTTSIISQLMQIEALPQTNLKNQVSGDQKIVSSLQGLNTKLAALFTSAGALGSASGWSAMTATSSNSNVTAVASAGASQGQLSFTVDRLATAFQAQYAATGTDTATGTVAANTSYTVTFTDGRPAYTFNSGDGSLKSVAAALNASGSGVTATLVPVSGASGSYTYALDVQDQTTGAASGFSIAPSDSQNTTPFAGGTSSTTAGNDAQISLNGQSTSQLKSSTNTFKSLMPGVDVTVGAVSTSMVTVTVGHDQQSISNSVKSMVDSINSILSDIDTATAYDASTKTGGTLSGDSTIRDLRDKLMSAVSGGVGGMSLASVGIQTDRDGKLVFDAAKFASAYASDPAGTQAKFAGGTVTNGTTSTTITTGFASAIASVADNASNSTTGSVTLEIQGYNSSIKTMNDSIADWDTRLADKQAALQKQYADLEVALGKLQDQSTWLAGQIGSLPSTSSKSS